MTDNLLTYSVILLKEIRRYTPNENKRSKQNLLLKMDVISN